MGWITVDRASPGMVLVSPVTDRMGRLLIPAGAELSERHVQSLAAWGVDQIEIESDEPILAARVLLAEDDMVNTMVATAMLQKLGCEVEAVPDGEKAVAAAAAGRFDVILLDGRMPVMDGFDAARALRARPDLDAVPILTLTADHRESERERARQVGMDDYLTKPITLQALRTALEKWLRPGARTVVASDPDAVESCLDPAASG